ncbi:protein phosphatase 2C domain-containing protein [Streptomyces durocortorensis]|uniref:Protein phosphatase 2C domain-containing protein n=1 Tax=Streptomyces durocortorensis TaxID=2811104 RepID=A0ABS2HRV6_9ACTN|nr:protein phosphatase 2C domain-containing protein [Streptomyces durocortorensis]MBM7053037.1 protein phosphatase 2C domain-containing protein [Streptomyces durocortorensis]
MSQSHQQPALSKCPGCEEPLDAGDLFCGACGYDLSAVPARPGDRPTMAITVPPAGAAAPAAEAVRWPAAAETDSSDVPAPVHRPADLPGTDSGGRPLTGPEHGQQPVPEPTGGPGPVSAAGPVGGAESSAVPVRHDDRAAQDGAEHAGDFALAAPDPRTAEHAAAAPAAPAAGAKVCVACRSGRVDPDGYCENCGHAQPRERDHMEQELGSVAAVSDRGLRHHRNEDSFAVSSTALPDGSPAVVAIVCDGVSSASRPDEASAAAASAANESLLESLPRGTHPQQAMHEAIVAASEAVNALAQEPAGAMEHDAHRHQNAPACTLVGAIMAGELLIVGWVGDSRVYWVPEDRTQPTARLTEDDSWAAQMVAAGLMNEAEAYADERAHAITGWLGADAYELEPHTAAFKPDRPGLVVVCTDGLWNYAESAEEMAAAVPADAQQHPLRAAQVLVGHALDGGGHDNVTVALVPFAVRPQGAGSACETV